MPRRTQRGFRGPLRGRSRSAHASEWRAAVNGAQRVAFTSVVPALMRRATVLPPTGSSVQTELHNPNSLALAIMMGLLQIEVLDQRKYRSELFLADDRRVRGYGGDQSGQDEGTGGRVGIHGAVPGHARAFCRGSGQPCLKSLALRGSVHRAHGGRRIHAVADDNAIKGGLWTLAELPGKLGRDVDALHGDRDLPGIGQRPSGEPVDKRSIDAAVIEDYGGIVAAELKAEILEHRCRRCGNSVARRRTTGEGDHPDEAVCHEMLA